MKFKNIAKTLIVSLLTVSFLFSTSLPSYAEDDYEYLRNMSVSADGGTAKNVKYIDMYYDHDAYVSLRDMAAALAGTGAAFDVSIEKDTIRLSRGGVYSPVGGEGSAFTVLTRDPSSKEYVRRRNTFILDGQNVHYYTFIYKDEETGYYDCFMYLPDLALLLNKNLNFTGNTLSVDSTAPLSISPEALEKSGYFLATNAVLLGDITNGEIYYSYRGDLFVPMASTTKLMSYIVAMDAISSGAISYDTSVTTSAAVEKLSNSIDGGFLIKEGTTVTVEELLYAMLLPSSNECTLALAEAVAGSEKAFVGRMNEKAKAIGLSEETEFFTCNGLPVYTEDVLRSKVQNRISAEDMFKLVCYLMSRYPQVTDITSCTYKTLPSFGRTVYNTNPMLYNVPGCIGFKTGTTNKAGACLVSAVSVSGDNGIHTICCIELGAEDIVTRNNVSQLMLTYGKNVYKNGGASSIPEYNEGEENTAEDLFVPVTGALPESGDELARLLIWSVRNNLPIPEPELIELPEGEGE